MGDEKRFDIKTESKIIIKISKIFKAAENPISEEEGKKSNGCLMDLANVCMIVAKSERAKKVLSRFIAQGASKIRIPELSYQAIATTSIIKSKYSTEYMFKIMEIFKILDESATFSINKDYPLTVESKDFKVILAPIIEQD